MSCCSFSFSAFKVSVVPGSEELSLMFFKLFFTQCFFLFFWCARDEENLSSMKTSSIIPVDLNGFLLQVFMA